MDAIEEKRLFTERGGRTVAFVASELGVATVGIADDRVGEVRIDRRCTPRDIASGDRRVAVATETDVLYWTSTVDEDDGSTQGEHPAFTSLDGPDATAVGFDGDVLRAADADGTIHAYDGAMWSTIGTVDGTVTAIDGGFIGADSGLYRVADGLQDVGLTAVRDVSATPIPRAATADGLFTLGNGWLATIDGDFRLVTAVRGGEHAHATTAETVYAYDGGDWSVIDVPVTTPIVDIAYGDNPCLLAADGTLALVGETGWRTFPLGLPDVVGMVIP